MSRIGITYQEVSEAIKKLQERGKIPTVDRIRESLGTGSNSTISRYLREWRSEGSLGSQALPSELFEAVKELWAKLQSKVDQQIFQSQQETDQTVQAAQSRFILLQKENSDLEIKIHKLEDSLYLKTEENKEINQTLASEMLELSRLGGHADTLEKQLNDQKSENKRLHELLNNVQKNLEHYQLSIQRLQQEQSVAMKKQTTQYQQELSQLKQQLSDQTVEKDRIKLLFEQISSALEKSELERGKIQACFREKELKVETLQDRYDRLAEQHQNNTLALENQTKLLIETKQKLETEIKQVLELRQALKQTKDKVDTLRHEQLFLIQEKSNFEGQLKQFQELTNKNKAVA